jgi:hypothetical protein
VPCARPGEPDETVPLDLRGVEENDVHARGPGRRVRDAGARPCP